MKTNVVIFPFDLFGTGGAAAGAQLLCDAIREMLDDNRRERVPTRACAYRDHVKVEEFTFDKLAAYEDWRDKGRRTVRKSFRSGDFLFWIAGSHLGVLPVYDELAAEREATLVVQLDAHLDVYNLSDCKSELSHGNFLLHCDGKLPPIINVGHRELLLKQEYVQRYYQKTYSAAELAVDPEPALANVREASKKAGRVFIDIDWDVLDAAYFPAVGHAVPFGLTPQMLLRVLDAAWSERVVGVALSEFEPGRDVKDKSLATAAWLIEYLLLKRHE